MCIRDRRAEDPGWKIESRLKGTESDFKRMDPVFRVRIAAVLKSWGEEHRIAEAMAEMKLDAYQRFLKEGIQSKMILQVHDELNFSVLPEEQEKVKQIVIEEMESAYKMKAPLLADSGWGQNWLEAH